MTVALLIAALSASIAQAADVRNLVTNPGFEAGMEGWDVAFGGAGTTTGIDTEVKAGGEQSFTAVSEERSLRVGAVQNVHLPGPGIYAFRAMLKVEGIERGGNPGVMARIQFKDAQGASVAPNLEIIYEGAESSDWTMLERTFDVPAGVAYLRTELLIYRAAGKVWWDDVSITGSPQPDQSQEAEAARENWLSNPGFEEGLTDWKPWIASGNPEAVIDESTYHSGKASVRLTGFGPSDRVAIGRIVEPITPGEAYTLEGWVKTQGVERSGAVHIRVQFNSEKDRNVKTQPHLFVGRRSGTSDWELVRERFVVPEGTGSLSIELFLDSSKGTVWWDDIALYQSKAPVPEIVGLNADELESGAVRLNWSLPEHVSGSGLSFRIYRATLPDFDVARHPPVGVSEDTWFIDRNTTAGSVYYYRVVPIGPDGKIYNPSAAMQVQVDSVSPGHKAESLYAEPARDGVRLEWDLGDSRARQVLIERAVAGEEPMSWEMVTLLPSWVETYVDRGLGGNVARGDVRYRMTVVDPEGKEAPPLEAPITGYIPGSGIDLSGTHPSLFISRDEIDAFNERSRQDGTLRLLLNLQIVQPARSLAARYAGADVVLPPKGDNSGHSELARNARIAALGYAFTGEDDMAQAAEKILLAYAAEYENYPLELAYDGRVTTQTLDESGWLIDLAWAYDLIYDSGLLTGDERRSIESDLLWEAVNVIDRYDKHLSNWQAWHNAAIGSVAFLLGDQAWIDEVLSGPQGFTTHVREGIRADGIWWEQSIGYHGYTRQALTYLAEIAYRHGYDLYRYVSRGKSLKLMFDAPYYHAFSDMFHPVVGNAGYGSRLAFDWTYGLALKHYGDPRYAWLFQEASGSSNRFPPVLYMDAVKSAEKVDQVAIGFQEFGPGGRNVAGSSLLQDTGMVVLRGSGIMPGGPEAAVLYKPHGTTIGHQAADNLTLMLEGLGGRWLPGPGSFSYSSPEQGSWYKHTVARNGVVVDERSQYPQDVSEGIFVQDRGPSSAGRLNHFIALPSASLADVQTGAVYDGVDLRRTVIVSAPYVIDRYVVTSNAEHTYDYVLHVDAEEGPISVDLKPKQGPLGQRAGYQHITDVRSGVEDGTWQAVWTKPSAAMKVVMVGGAPTEVIRASGLGPSLSRQPMLVARRQAKETEFVGVFELFGDESVVDDVSPIDRDDVAGVAIHRAGVTDRFLWRTSPEESAPASPSSANGKTVTLSKGESFAGRSAFLRSGGKDQTSVGIVLDGTLLGLRGVRVTTDIPADLAVERSPEGTVAVTHNSRGERKLKARVTGTNDLKLYRLQMDEAETNVIAVPIQGVETDFVDGAQTLTWSAEAGVVYVLSPDPPQEQWLDRFSVNLARQLEN